MTDRAYEIADDVVIAACRKIALKGDDWISLALKENADVFMADFAAALRSYADERLEMAAELVRKTHRGGKDPFTGQELPEVYLYGEAAARMVLSLKSKEPQS